MYVQTDPLRSEGRNADLLRWMARDRSAHTAISAITGNYSGDFWYRRDGSAVPDSESRTPSSRGREVFRPRFAIQLLDDTVRGGFFAADEEDTLSKWITSCVRTHARTHTHKTHTQKKGTHRRAGERAKLRERERERQKDGTGSKYVL